MIAKYWGYNYHFIRPVGTSRGIMTEKPCYFIEVTCDGVMGRGECGILPGLSIEDFSRYEEKLKDSCMELTNLDPTKWKKWAENNSLDADWYDNYKLWPSIVFAIELALMQWKSLKKSNSYWNLFDTPFTRREIGLPINGLLWMGDKCYLNDQLDNRLLEGYRCIKMKVGAINIEQELDILRTLRDEKPKIQIRVDANGGYDAETALVNMARMEKFNIHSIEQPCAADDIDALAKVSREGIIPIALDESLIGLYEKKQRDILLDIIKPAFIVLKPSLLGGFRSCEDWISRAKVRGIKWWITSALEGNEGLTGIAQWASSISELEGFQGFGTGSLYSNNTPAKTVVRDGNIWMI